MNLGSYLKGVEFNNQIIIFHGKGEVVLSNIVSGFQFLK